MARKVNVIVVDDLDGTELPEGQAEVVNFALDGVNYEIDLTEKNATALRKAFGKYVEAGRKTGRGNVVNIRRRANKAAAGDGPDPKVVREWAASAGIELASRGRIPAEIVQKFQAANG